MPLRVSDSDLWLELAAKFSIIASVLVIIYFFVFTAWRITRFPNNQYWPFNLNVFSHRQEIHQTPTQMPFTLKLKERSVNDVDQFNFHLSCSEHPKSISLLWGIDASYLYKLINTHNWDFIRDLEVQDTSHTNDSGAVGSDKPFLHLDTIRLAEPSDGKFDYQVTVLTPSSLNWTDLNNQYKYPLVMFIWKSQEASNSPMLGSEFCIVGLCTLLHVKNAVIPRATAILAQYVKLANGQAHKLQPLFVMDGATNSQDEDNPDGNDINLEPGSNQTASEPFEDVLCSVCQTLPVSRAIIPCRHVCLCAQCFGKVQNCPICRGFITYYFKTRSENYMQEQS